MSLETAYAQGFQNGQTDAELGQCSIGAWDCLYPGYYPTGEDPFAVEYSRGYQEGWNKAHNSARRGLDGTTRAE